jgi:hypothetical protein
MHNFILQLSGALNWALRLCQPCWGIIVNAISKGRFLHHGSKSMISYYNSQEYIWALRLCQPCWGLIVNAISKGRF